MSSILSFGEPVVLFEEERILLLIFILSGINSFIGDAFWNSTKPKMFFPKIQKLERKVSSLKKEAALYSRNHTSADTIADAEILEQIIEVEKLLAAENAYMLSRPTATKLMPFIIFYITKYGFIIPMKFIHWNKEIAIVPDYFIKGLYKRLMYGQDIGELASRFVTFIISFGQQLPALDTSPLAYRNEWCRSFDVISWSLVCLLFWKVVLLGR
eukprot:Tbor_TRINITY_DN2976_c0_g1::TRINITY_DN2976_c0_g1_i1::g.1152::m.1152